jgi:hypothetical protein
MGSYFYGRGIKFQLTGGVGLDIRFSLVSDILKSNSVDIFLNTGLWWRSSHQHCLEDLGLSFIPSVAVWRRALQSQLICAPIHHYKNNCIEL